MEYRVSFEVAAPLAMFARPDTGGTPTSYPARTWSAAKGLFELIAFLSDGAAWICPTKVEICRPMRERCGRVCYQRYTTNYGGPLREPSLRNSGMTSGGSGMQFFATVLSNVCYRLYGTVVGPYRPSRNNAKHFLKDLLDRRLKQGRCFRTPCLGWSEFTCSYWGPFRCVQLPGANGSLEENATWKEHCERWDTPFRDESEVQRLAVVGSTVHVIGCLGQAGDGPPGETALCTALRSEARAPKSRAIRKTRQLVAAC